MRTLTFIARGQTLKPSGNFRSLVAGSKGYLKAAFKLNRDHDDCKHIAVFETSGKEYAVQLDADCTCMIPSEALVGATFSVCIVSLRTDYRIQTGKVVVKQNV